LWGRRLEIHTCQVFILATKTLHLCGEILDLRESEEKGLGEVWRGEEVLEEGWWIGL
jgi:hypothetical protein